jgi:hypothetical protein
MARTAITSASIRQLEHQGVTVSAGAADLAMEAADDVNGNDVDCTGKEILIVENTDSGAQTVTITAAPDEFGRTGAITTYSLDAGDYAIFGPFPTSGWRQTDGKLYIDASDALVYLGILRTP